MIMTSPSVAHQKFAEDIELLSLEQLECTPIGPRQNFFVDLWNAIIPHKITKRSFMGSTPTNEFMIRSQAKNMLKVNVLRISNSDISNQMQGKSVSLNPSALFQEISQGIAGRYFADSRFKIRVKDGLLILEEDSISYVAGAIERYTLPKQIFLEDLFAVIFLAKSIRVENVNIARGLERFYQHGTKFGEIRNLHGQRFFNNSSLQHWDQVLEVARYFMGEIHIITPTNCGEIPENIQVKLAGLPIKWISMGAQVSESQKTAAGLNRIKVLNLKKAIQASFEWAETPANIFFLSGIESAGKDSKKREHEFVREVLSW